MLYYARCGEKWGYIDASGTVVVPIEATECTLFAEGLGGVLYGEDLDIVDSKGNLVGHHKNVITLVEAEYSNGLLCICDRDTRKVGYIDRSGKWVINPTFRDARDFGNGVAIAQGLESSNVGIVDTNGDWMCVPKFYRVFNFDESTASTLGFSREFGCRLVDKSGNPVCDDRYDAGHRAGEGLIPVERNSKWGVVTETGDTVIPFKFDGIDPFSGGYAPTRTADKKFGVLDREGNWAIQPKFDFIDEFGEGLFAAATTVDSQLAWGYIDVDGAWVIEPSFGEVGTFKGGVAYVRPLSSDGEEVDDFGYINRCGHYIWEPR